MSKEQLPDLLKYLSSVRKTPRDQRQVGETSDDFASSYEQFYERTLFEKAFKSQTDSDDV